MEQNNGKVFAIISLVGGVLGVLTMCCYGFGAIPGLVGIICGIISRKKEEGLKGMAIAGIICGAVAVVVGVIMLLLVLLGVGGSFLANM